MKSILLLGIIILLLAEARATSISANITICDTNLFCSITPENITLLSNTTNVTLAFNIMQGSFPISSISVYWDGGGFNSLPANTINASVTHSITGTESSSTTTTIDPTTSTSSTSSTSITTSPVGVVESSGGSVGASGTGGGSFKPTVLPYGYGVEILNLTDYDTQTVYLGNSTFTIQINFITPNSTGITINNQSHTLSLNATEGLPDGYGVEAISISYLLIIHTEVMNLLLWKQPSGTTISSSTSIASSSTAITTASSTSTIAYPQPTASSTPKALIIIVAIFLITATYCIFCYKKVHKLPFHKSEKGYARHLKE